MEPPEVSWDFAEVHRVMHNRMTIPTLDHPEPYAIVNAAGQPFTPAPTYEVAYPILTITRNELQFDRIKASLYAYAVLLLGVGEQGHGQGQGQACDQDGFLHGLLWKNECSGAVL
jgi:hypothetical protein